MTKPETDEEQDAPFPAADEIVVSGRRGVPLTYAGGRDLIESETLRKYPAGELGSVLRRSPGVYIQPENGHDARIHVGLRGNDPRRSGLAAVLVDGIPVAEAPYGNTDIDGLPISFERIWRTDVIRGGASVRYGPNSAGGVVNFLTEPIPDGPLLRFGARFGSHDDLTYSTTTGASFGDFGFLASGVHREGDGFREKADFESDDGMLKLEYALGEGQSVSGSVSRFSEPRSNQAGGLTQAAYDQDPDQSLRQNNFFRFDTTRYTLRYENQIDAETDFQLLSWWQEGHRILSDVRPVEEPFEVTRVQDSTFTSGALEARYAWSQEFGGQQHSFYHSARYLVETNDERYYRRPLPSGPIQQPLDLNAMFKGKAFSLFNEDKIALTDDLEWALGLRTESLVMSGESHDDGTQIVKNYTEFLPETNLAWTFREETALFASYQETFYPPQYETGFDPGSVLYAPTSPESARAYELGLRSREFEGLELELAVFETRFTDKIDFVNTPDGKLPVNSGDAVSHGAELSLSYDLGASADSLEGFSVYGSYTEQRSKVTSGANDGNDTPDAPHRLASWGLDYEHEVSGLWARVGGSYSGSSYKDIQNTPVGTDNGLAGPVPAFTLWDAALGWHQHPDEGGWSLSFGVTNLFDEDYYRRFATGIYPGAPQEMFVMASYSVRF